MVIKRKQISYVVTAVSDEKLEKGKEKKRDLFKKYNCL